MQSSERSSRISRERLPLLTHGSGGLRHVFPFRLAFSSRPLSLDLVVGFARFSTNFLRFLHFCPDYHLPFGCLSIIVLFLQRVVPGSAANEIFRLPLVALKDPVSPFFSSPRALSHAVHLFISFPPGLVSFHFIPAIHLLSSDQPHDLFTYPTRRRGKVTS